jgi:hypothetical protein
MPSTAVRINGDHPIKITCGEMRPSVHGISVYCGAATYSEHTAVTSPAAAFAP